MPFLAQKFEEHLKNTLVLFVHMTSYLQLLFDPTRTLCGITSKFTLSRAWDTTVVYLLTLQRWNFVKNKILAHCTQLIERWISASNWDSTREVNYRFSLNKTSHTYVRSPPSRPSTPLPPPTSPSGPSPVDCRYVVCLIVRAHTKAGSSVS